MSNFRSLFILCGGVGGCVAGSLQMNSYIQKHGLHYVDDHLMMGLFKGGLAGVFYPISVPYMIINKKPFFD